MPPLCADYRPSGYLAQTWWAQRVGQPAGRADGRKKAAAQRPVRNVGLERSDVELARGIEYDYRTPCVSKFASVRLITSPLASRRWKPPTSIETGRLVRCLISVNIR
jgi:hypothetical protein